MQDLSTLSISSLVALHNQHVPEDKHIRSFRDRATAVKRVKAVLPKERDVIDVSKPKKASAEPKQKRGPRFVFAPMMDQRAPREGCRRRILFDLLDRPEGTTQPEVMEKVSLTERQSYEAIRLIHYIHGYGLRQEGDRIFLVHPKAK